MSGIFGKKMERASETMPTNTFLTVQDKSKVEVELLKHEETVTGPSRLLTILKWLVTIFLSLLVLISLTLSKLSAVFIGQSLNNMTLNNLTLNKTKYGTISAESNFLWLLLMMMVPYFATMLRSVWCGALRRDRPWPTNAAIIWVRYCN